MRRLLAVVALTGAGMLACVPAAQAQGPARTGWWNTATVSGTALPATTPPDQLHLAQGPAGPLAFAAVSYPVPTYASAELVLHVASGSEIGTPAVLLCPTRDDRWKAGGDQPVDAAPAFDCAGRSVTAVLGSDAAGTTLTFLLDPSLQLAPGTTSLAVLPAPGSAPFSLDLAAPDALSLTVGQAPAPVVRNPATTPPTQPGTDAVAPPAGTGFAPPPGQVPFVLPPAVVSPPSLATSVLPPTVAAPQVPVGTAQAVRLRLSTSEGRREATVLLALVVGGFAAVLSQQRREPLRLLGGRSRAVDSPAEVTGPARGIGRFARPRSSAAKMLR